MTSSHNRESHRRHRGADSPPLHANDIFRLREILLEIFGLVHLHRRPGLIELMSVQRRIDEGMFRPRCENLDWTIQFGKDLDIILRRLHGAPHLPYTPVEQGFNTW